MGNKQSAQSGSFKTITLRRDGKGALQFKGERIGSATRTWTDNDQEPAEIHEVSAKLFRTSGGKYVAGIEDYNKTAEEYHCRCGFADTSLDALSEALRKNSEYSCDDDILGELFEDTEIAQKFVEHID